MSRRKLMGRCESCGQSVTTTQGHVGNWPRRLARQYPDFTMAVNALLDNIDSDNQDFAIPEFIDERVKMALEAREATHDV